MKRHWFKLGGLLALALVLSLIASMLPTGSAIAFIPGDADGDGDVDVFDLVKVKRIILEIDDPTPGGDADLDGDVDVFDLVKVKRIILGIPPEFEVVDIDQPSEIQPCQDLIVSVDVRNAGEKAGDSFVEVWVEDGEGGIVVAPQTLKVPTTDPGSTFTVEDINLGHVDDTWPDEVFVVAHSDYKGQDLYYCPVTVLKVERWTLTLIAAGCCGIQADGVTVLAGETEVIPDIESCTTYHLEPIIPPPPPYCIPVGWLVDGVPTAPNPDGSIDIHMGQNHEVMLVCELCPEGGWNVEYQAYGWMLLYTSIRGAEAGAPIPSPATCNWEMNFSCEEIQGSLHRVLTVPAASWYWVPYSFPWSAGPPLNWVTIDVTLDADGSGQLFTAGPDIDVDVLSDTCDTVNAMWDCKGDPQGSGKCLCGLCDPCGPTTTMANCVTGTCVVIGDGATSATEVPGSAVLFLPLTSHVYSAFTGPTDPYDPTTWGNEILTVPLNFTFTTEMAYATMHDSNLDGLPGIALDGVTFPAGPGMPFIALLGYAPYVGTMGVMVAASGLVDGVALGSIELDVLHNMVLMMAPWELVPTITPTPTTLGDTITVAVDVHRIGGPPRPVPVGGYIMDVFDGIFVASLGLQMTGSLAICNSETLTWATILKPAHAGMYILTVGATTFAVENPGNMTPSLPGLTMGSVGNPVDVVATVNNANLEPKDFTVVLSIEDPAKEEVFRERETITVPGNDSNTATLTWDAPEYAGMYTARVLDPVTSDVLAIGSIFVQ